MPALGEISEAWPCSLQEERQVSCGQVTPRSTSQTRTHILDSPAATGNPSSAQGLKAKERPHESRGDKEEKGVWEQKEKAERKTQ